MQHLLHHSLIKVVSEVLFVETLEFGFCQVSDNQIGAFLGILAPFVQVQLLLPGCLRKSV